MMLPEDILFQQRIAQGCAEVLRISEIEYEYNPRTLVYQHDKVKLYHYHSKSKKQHTIPLLVVFATVNRPEVLDLFPDHSVIGDLLESGMDVFLLDWGYPDSNDKNNSLTDYVCQYLNNCIQFIIENTQHPKINLMGICQGGTICCYAALFSTVKNLVLISAPIDFKTNDNIISHVFSKLNVDDFINLVGNVSGAWLTQFFISLRPFELVGMKYLRFIDNLEDRVKTEKFLRVEKWLHDAPDQTGASFKELVKDLYQGNKLIKGEFYLGEQLIDLSRIEVPILNMMASEDEIVPPCASRALKTYVKSEDYTQQIYPGGHIGIYISDKVGKRMPSAIAKWLKQR